MHYSTYYGLADGCSFGTDAGAVGGIFDISSGEVLIVLGYEGTTHPKHVSIGVGDTLVEGLDIPELGVG